MTRRFSAVAGLGVAGVLMLTLVIAWSMRFRIAAEIVNQKLAAAHVTASYQLTRIGPLRERMENVRIGNPATPDLIARRIDVELGYGWAGPFVRALTLDGVRLRAELDSQGLHLGTIDRLLPKSSGGQARLPDLDVRLHDVEVDLATPNGRLRAALAGSGNPAKTFQGTAHVQSPAPRLASCALRDVDATFRIAVSSGNPQAEGPVRIASTTCPGLTARAGTAHVLASADSTFTTFAIKAMLDGFGGEAGPARFAQVAGRVEAAGKIGALAATARLHIRALALPAAARRVSQSAASLAGTPIGPTSQRASVAMAGLLAQSDATADITANIHGLDADFHLARLQLAGRDGAKVIAIERGGLTWSARGWRADADIETAGGALPALAIELRQSAPGAPLRGTARLAPFGAGTARLAASPLNVVWDGARATFDTIVRIDGPIGDGFVYGLSAPLRGTVTATGALVVDPGCQPVTFQRLRLAAFTFDPTHITLCGKPIVSRTAARLRIDAETGPLHLAGRTADGVPLMLDLARLQVTDAGFTATDAHAALGPPDRQTYFAIAALGGRYRDGRIGGSFAGTSGAIANVPLKIEGASGSWSFGGSRLHLAGDLRVSDAAAAPRFNPLSTDDATIDLQDGVLRATATLREPASKAEIVRVDIMHDLPAASGHASLGVTGITFAPKGLQPDRLTPLTLGVVANVAGTISGQGRIDWTAQGVTSSGIFGTDKIDLAAAFGPVSGIKATVHFTDLLGLVSAPAQEATIAEINPGVLVANCVVHYQLIGQNRVAVQDASWPFAGGKLRLDPTMLDFGADAERRLTFRIDGLDAAAFVQQLDFPNIAATGTFDGVLPMIFDQAGGRIAAGSIVARGGGGTLAYVGELSNAQLGTMGKLAFDALKAIRYSSLDISLDGRLDGEMVSRVRFTGIREATPEQSLVTRLIRNLPFRFNIQIRAPFRGLVGSARAYIDPRLLLNQVQDTAPPPPPVRATTPAEPSIQTQESGRPL